MRRVYRRKRSYMCRSLGIREQHTHVKTALGMCNHINLFAAGLAHNSLDTSAQLLGALLDRRGAVVLAVIDGRTVSLKLARYASPVADMLEIAEKHTVHHQDRIFCTADLAAVTLVIKQYLFALKTIFSVNSDDNVDKHNEICDRHHTEDYAEHALFQPQLPARYIDDYYSDPKHNRAKQHYQHGFQNKSQSVLRPSGKAERRL